MLEFLAWEILKMGKIGGVDLCWPKDGLSLTQVLLDRLVKILVSGPTATENNENTFVRSRALYIIIF